MKLGEVDQEEDDEMGGNALAGKRSEIKKDIIMASLANK